MRIATGVLTKYARTGEPIKIKNHFYWPRQRIFTIQKKGDKTKLFFWVSAICQNGPILHPAFSGWSKTDQKGGTRCGGFSAVLLQLDLSWSYLIFAVHWKLA